VCGSQVEPTDTKLLAGAMTLRFVDQYLEVSLPCDTQGIPR
jgi:hypothetical protein